MGPTIQVLSLTVGQMQANCYIVYDDITKEALIVDPGDDGDYIIQKITDLALRPKGIIATHGHFDHIMAALEVKLAFGIPFFIHKADEFLLAQMQSSANHFLGILSDPPVSVDKNVDHQQYIQLGINEIKVLHTPGHTPGSICLSFPKQRIILTGDVIFARGNIGRTDFSYSKPLELLESIHAIFAFPGDTLLYPGHGKPTTIEEEKLLHKAKYN